MVNGVFYPALLSIPSEKLQWDGGNGSDAVWSNGGRMRVKQGGIGIWTQ